MAGLKNGAGRWAVVLAGGEGERLKPFVSLWKGDALPKQYCDFDGEGTMLERALARAARLAPHERTLTVIGPGHGRHLARIPARLPGLFLEQPANRETGPGILLPAAHALKRDRDATLIFLPSDHFIDGEQAFAAQVESAAELAEARPDRLVLLAAEPEGPERDYGWVEPRRAVEGPRGPAYEIARFREKPGREEAERLHRGGALWNTMIMAVKARTLWAMARRRMAKAASAFEALLPAIGTVGERRATELVYEEIGPANFSRELLEPEAASVLALSLRGVKWSDWGRPARIVESLSRAGRIPSFPISALTGLDAAA